MSQGDRMCKSCGKPLPRGLRKCPDCGRLSINGTRERLGSRVSSEQIKPSTEIKPVSTGSGELESSDSTPPIAEANTSNNKVKPSSHYAIAGPYQEPDNVLCPKCEEAYLEEGQCPGCGYTKSSGESSGCCSCASLFILMTWIMSMIYIL